MHSDYLAQAAYLYSRGFTQAEIAAILGLKPADVGRLIRRARALGLLEEPKFSEEVFRRLWTDADKRIKLEDLRFGLRLLKCFQDQAGMGCSPLTLIEVKVVSSLSLEEAKGCWEDRLTDFGRKSLPYLQEVLAKAECCAVGWGASVAAPIAAAEQYGLAGATSSLTIAATCGELFDYLDFGNSSSRLVERLHVLFKGQKGSVYTFRGVPALVENAGIRDFFLLKHPGYRAVFGSDGIADRFDAVLTSVGTFGQYGVHAFKKALIAEWGVKEASLKEIAWGDLGGVLVPRGGLSREAQAEFDRISSLWTGFSLNQYSRIARRAARFATGKNVQIPGVVVFAIGGSKAEIVHEIIKAGLVNRLVIDLDLARALALRANINLFEHVHNNYQLEHGLETVQKIVAALERLTDEDRAAVLERLRHWR